MPEANENKVIELPLEWNIPDDLVARYATNMIVQRSEHEFIISFFEVKPPLLLGEPEAIIEQAKKIKSIRANCVAQVIVAFDKMPLFIEALQKNWNKFQSQETEEQK